MLLAVEDDSRDLMLLAVEDDSVVLGLEPLHGVLLGQPVGEPNSAGLAAPVTDVHAGSAHDHVEVHTVDSNAGIVLDAQVDVLLDTKPKVAVLREVLSPQLVLLHLQSPLENLLGLGTPDGAVDGDLLVPPDTETTDSVAGFAEHRGLPCQRLKHLPALVSLSPDSPTQMLRQSFRILRSLIGFFALASAIMGFCFYSLL